MNLTELAKEHLINLGHKDISENSIVPKLMADFVELLNKAPNCEKCGNERFTLPKQYYCKNCKEATFY